MLRQPHPNRPTVEGQRGVMILRQGIIQLS
ncbi:hypothetical protein ABIE18_004115 [Arthrobacter sp. 2762]